MALIESWETFIRIHGGEPGARNVFEKAIDELLRAENQSKEVHLVKAAPGDGGIDVYVHQPDGIDIYQCKFFMGSMNRSRWAQITNSFETAMKPKGVKILNWFLCMPREMQKEDINTWNKFLKENSSYNVNIKLIDGNEIIHRMENCDRIQGTDFISRYFTVSSSYVNKRNNVADNRKSEESYGSFLKDMIPLSLLLYAIILLRFYCKHFYNSTGSLPNWLDILFSSVKNCSTWTIIFICIAILMIMNLKFRNSLEANCILFGGFTISDFEYNIHEFTRMLYDKEDSKKLNVTLQKNNDSIANENEHTWTAEREGLIFTSNKGNHIDYMLLNTYEYNGTLSPLCIAHNTTKNNAYRLLKEQGFTLIWQNDTRACYKKDDWTLFLFFGGIMKLVVVEELIRGEGLSLFEQVVQNAEVKSNEEIMEFVKLKEEWESSKEELRQFFSNTNSLDEKNDLKEYNQESEESE